MLICDKNFSCCNWQYADRLGDIDEEFRHCDKLLEVEVVRHGKWMPDGTCTNCGIEKPVVIAYRGLNDIVYQYQGDLNYCPNCGTKMDLE